jgi:hypothetical protein
MHKQPFQIRPFADFNVEAQILQVGLGEENFQISVPRGEMLDQISYLGGGIKRERIKLQDDGVGTSYTTVPVMDGFWLFENSGVALFRKNGSHKVFSELLDDTKYGRSRSGPARLRPDGGATVFLQELRGFDHHIVQYVAFPPASPKYEILVSLPYENEHGVLDRLYLRDGFLALRHPQQETDTYQPPQFYDWDGKPQPHLLSNALSLLHKSQIDLCSPRTGYEQGAFHVSQTKDAWGVFRWEGMPRFNDQLLFLLSVTDTVQVLPVLFGRQKMGSKNDLSFVRVHPHLNLFLVGVKDGGARVFVYLGHVRKAPDGKSYVARTFQLGFFDEVVSPVFSRNGEMFLFATRTGLQTNLVFARLADLLAEANRRYPDALLDIEALKAEVK